MMKALAVIAVLVVILSTAGCGWLRRSEPAPTPLQQQVEIPAEIFRGEQVEPQVRVYIAERNEIVTMEFEEYIMGVVAAEMDVDWPIEALAAQAIMARTFTLQKIAEQRTLPNRDAHASTDIEEFQAYNAERINDNVRQAVEKTRGEVAVYQGQFIRGWFHAYCGGKTALPSVGLNFADDDPPYMKPVNNPCVANIDEEQRYWSKSFTKGEIREAVRQVTDQDPGDFGKMEIVAAVDDRVVTFRVGEVEVSAPELRLALGSTEMRSAVVTEIDVNGNAVRLAGRGFGHGVGLCQWGAKAWAEQGKSAEEIVQSFFPGAGIQKIWQ